MSKIPCARHYEYLGWNLDWMGGAMQFYAVQISILAM